MIIHITTSPTSLPFDSKHQPCMMHKYYKLDPNSNQPSKKHLPNMSLLFLLLLLSTTTTTATTCTTKTTLRTYKTCLPLSTQSASLAWTYHPSNSTLHLAFLGSFLSPSGWVAWGVNPVSPEMIGARVLVAFFDPSSGGLTVLPFVLGPDVKLQQALPTSKALDVPLKTVRVVKRGGGGGRGPVAGGDVVEIHATLRLDGNGTTMHHVWNRGVYMQGYSPTVHPMSPTDLNSRGTFDVTSKTPTEVFTVIPLWVRPTHAILNSVSWGFLLPLGVASARYLRQHASTTPSWFYIHSTIQITGFLLGAAGFALGIILGDSSPGITYTLHRGLGIAAFSTASLQSLALLFRPKTTNRFRKYWKSYHHLIGYGCVVIGVVNVFQGFEVMGLATALVKLLYCLVLSTLLGMCFSLEVNSWVLFCRKSKEEMMRREGEGGFGMVVKATI